MTVGHCVTDTKDDGAVTKDFSTVRVMSGFNTSSRQRKTNQWLEIRPKKPMH